MSAPWRDEDEEFRVGRARGVLRSKPRFSFNEVKLLLEAVKKNRNILLKKFNHGVSSEVKKRKWAEITDQVNALGENHREMRQIMKKWADLKCDGKRRIIALRGPNGATIRKKTLGPVEKMVHDILMMSPRGDGESDPDFNPEEDLSKLHSNSSSSYLNLTDSSYSLGGGGALVMSPLSSPDKDGDPFQSSSEFDLDVAEDDQAMDFNDNEDSTFSCPDPLPPSSFTEPLSEDALLSGQPVHSYSRRPPGASTSSGLPEGAPSSSAAPLSSTSNGTSTSAAAPSPPPSSSSAAPPPAAPSVASKPHPSSSSDPLPAGGSTRHEHVFQMASQSLQQQQASSLLLTSVSQSLEALAQSVQLLVETQQEFVQESLLLQRETVDILRDFSNTALAMLRDKNSTGQTHPAPRY
ncbi:myb-related transcription factor, partner of profilin isoform X1 [Takifugu flavidus]|uniref:myb-related transcription factor, partner of profilin isoform X1 n=1 Tax=Takifugu flavidus TaxID=433684 RepID=UPI0025440029|nr:myb-related transcription factor, partner of profilin isoform X1 [Takifugu flavidus]XP_056904775.1 myb-related transcription factor, partner of profilin isoform X1 [Takifugu flavidus]